MRSKHSKYDNYKNIPVMRRRGWQVKFDRDKRYVWYRDNRMIVSSVAGVTFEGRQEMLAEIAGLSLSKINFVAYLKMSPMEMDRNAVLVIIAKEEEINLDNINQLNKPFFYKEWQVGFLPAPLSKLIAEAQSNKELDRYTIRVDDFVITGAPPNRLGCQLLLSYPVKIVTIEKEKLSTSKKTFSNAASARLYLIKETKKNGSR